MPNNSQTGGALQVASESFNIYDISDLELVTKIGRLNSNSDSSVDFFQSVVKSKRVGFVFGEMGISSNQLQALLSSFKESSNEEMIEKVFSVAISFALDQRELRLTCADILYGIVTND